MQEGFPGVPSGLDAAFVWGGNGKIYFFKGDKFWKFDPDRRPFIRKGHSHLFTRTIYLGMAESGWKSKVYCWAIRDYPLWVFCKAERKHQ
jgi:hypothetical protein